MPLRAFFSAMSSIMTTQPREIRIARGPVYSSEKNGVPSCWCTNRATGGVRQAPGGRVEWWVVGGGRVPSCWCTTEGRCVRERTRRAAGGVRR